ncbi:MAG: hypothetical protein US25_C0027G0010 [Candidatus Moranbacteria bacterium GW2011_GWE1_36_7]|nr:MAG: hypothetical protein UR99_C0056G0009 [Candidatus Moranbacteria bacterium GW2011_GWD2_36_12]KKQ04726.1 MAG: hypothetical protein US16_C0050G0010 [Candidatus Moranbacteria bacterium GW2011_GWE2_36_40]KKQ14345.1 MAG: hypothetical protein US25_C0027G0010 [Candidatus Moranbacteria bacterium GW2011_GWE1_36_7]
MPNKLENLLKDLINPFFKHLSREHHYSPEEVTYKIIDAKQNKTKITVSCKIRDLFSHQPPGPLMSQDMLSFDEIGESTCTISFRAGGMELICFSTFLKSIMTRLDHEKKQRVHSNRQLIEDETDKILEELEKCTHPIICPRKSSYSKGIYSATIYVGNEKLEYENRDVILLCKEIKAKLPVDIKDKRGKLS